jgi:hypothetical protein
MVGRKRLGYGSRGRQVQSVPRVPNSARVHILIVRHLYPNFTNRIFTIDRW